MKPNKRNFCGGAFPDWLEVNLTDKCNGNCSWCIEKNGYHPDYHAPWQDIANAALNHGALNIILLGGEPTMYGHIEPLIECLSNEGRHVWITTNGCLLSKKYVQENLRRIYGVNISIHDYNLAVNAAITGIIIKRGKLSSAIKALHEIAGANVRLNCNCIQESIDCASEIINYVKFARSVGANKVRFAELKIYDEGFVDLAKILNYKYGLNDNPFLEGCNSDCVIDGMPVNFRQMCGLQTTRRIKPEDPEQIVKKVLYYDGKIYDGWQTKGDSMNLRRVLELVEKNEISVDVALELIDGAATKESAAMKQVADDCNQELGVEPGSGCQY